MLEKLLYKSEIVVAVVVDSGGEEFSEAVSGNDTFKPKPFHRLSELVVYSPFSKVEYDLVLLDAVLVAVTYEIIIHAAVNGKPSRLSCLRLRDIETVSASVLDDVAQAELEYIGDAEPRVRLNSKRRSDARIRAHSAEPSLERLDYFVVLILGDDTAGGFGVGDFALLLLALLADSQLRNLPIQLLYFRLVLGVLGSELLDVIHTASPFCGPCLGALLRR